MFQVDEKGIEVCVLRQLDNLGVCDESYTEGLYSGDNQYTTIPLYRDAPNEWPSFSGRLTLQSCPPATLVFKALAQASILIRYRTDLMED